MDFLDFFSSLARVGGGRHLEVVCVHPEKAIMLCKANIIGDYKMYGQIQAAASPQEAKALRRSVSPFVPARWDALVCEVARAVCVQKALGVPELHARLLETGERVIAEMTQTTATGALASTSAGGGGSALRPPLPPPHASATTACDAAASGRRCHLGACLHQRPAESVGAWPAGRHGGVLVPPAAQCPSQKPPAIVCLCLCRSKSVSSCCVSQYAHVCPDVYVCSRVCVACLRGYVCVLG